MPSGVEWEDATIAEWERLWRLPQATQWLADDPQLRRYMLLWETVWVFGKATNGFLSEMRAIEDRHGLSPRSLLTLRWRIVDEYDDGRTLEPGEGNVHPIRKRKARKDDRMD